MFTSNALFNHTISYGLPQRREVGEGTPPILSTKVLAADADYLPLITEAGAGVGARPKIERKISLNPK